MNGFLNGAIEWAAKRILVQAVQRVAEIMGEVEKGSLPSLPAIVLPTIPQVEYHEAASDQGDVLVVTTAAPAAKKGKHK